MNVETGEIMSYSEMEKAIKEGKSEKEDFMPFGSESVLEHESRKKNIGRNAHCPCGSGKKYKKCHLLIDARNKNKIKNQVVSNEN